MTDFEGSSEVDNGSLPTQTINDDSNEEIEVRDEGDEGEGESQTQNEDGEEGEGQPKLTEKGTKLDPNPLSAAHQELANERRKLAQYQQVLSNPEMLKRYAAQMGMTLAEAKADIKEEQKQLAYTADRFKTPEDLANALNEMDGKYSKTIEELRAENQRLKEGFTGFSQSRQVERVANNMQRDVVSVREKYPELDPKSPEYDPELEKEIADFYEELDLDPATGGYKGQFSLAKIADRVMRASGRAMKKGSQQAQTNVRVKQAGKVVTSSKSPSKEGKESNDPGTVIAQRIAKAMSNG